MCDEKLLGIIVREQLLASNCSDKILHIFFHYFVLLLSFIVQEVHFCSVAQCMDFVA